MAKKMSLAEALGMFNLPKTIIPEEAIQEVTEHEALEDNRLLESESVIFYLETKGDQAIWKRRICALCGAKFLSSYTHVSLCSVECRKNYFASKGMKWDPTGKTEAERWGGQIPMVIGPEATKALQGVEFKEDEKSILTQDEPVPPVGLGENLDIEAFIADLGIDDI